MAFNEQQVEELELNQIFGNEDEEEFEDEYDAGGEFREYSDEELDERWSGYSFEDLLLELENIIGASKKYFFSKKKRVIDGEEITNIAKYILSRTPGEVAEARGIIDTKNKILAGAKADAETQKAEADAYKIKVINEGDSTKKHIIEQAELKAKQMVSDHEITRRAHEERNAIIAAAKKQARAIVDQANSDADAYIEAVSAWGKRNLDGINTYAKSTLGATRKFYQQGITDIDNTYRHFQESNQQRVNELINVPRFKASSGSNNKGNGEQE